MSKRKLLLADDSMTIQKVVNLTFADEGIEVFTVGNGSLAIEKLSEIEPDLVLADVHMPGLTGYEVCEQIRINPRFQHIPVMLLVGSFEPFDEREAERVGANDYLTKPFQSIRQLIQKVTTLLDSPPGGANEIAENQLPNVEIDDNQARQESAAPVNLYQDFSDNQSETVFAQDFPEAQKAFDVSSQELQFGDNALDDEMIETNSANNFNNIFANSASSNQFENQNFGAFEMPNEATRQNQLSRENLASENSFTNEFEIPEMRPTEPLSYNDIQEMNSSMLSPTAEPEKQNDWEIFEFETKTVSEPLSPIELNQNFSLDSSVSNKFTNQSNDDFALEFETPILQAESHEELLETSDFEFIGAEEMSQPQQTVQEAADFNFSAYQSPATTASQNEPLELDLDEMNLLQIDDEDSILDLQTEIVAASDSAVDLDVLSEQSNSGYVAPPNNNELLTQTANQAVANMNLDFPPHVIEAIARLVVEKLSDQVIEKIAWEIVPDRFDLIMRQQIENRNR